MILLTEEDAGYITRVLNEVIERRRRGVKEAIVQAKDLRDKALVFMQDQKDIEVLEQQYASCVNSIQLEAEKDELITAKCLTFLKIGSNMGVQNDE